MLHDRLVLVVVPAHCEEAHVADVVRTMPAFVDRILLVDDGSSDATVARARAVRDPRLEVHRHAARSGVGAAIVTGYRAAAAHARDDDDAIAVMAGDGQMHPADLAAVVEPIVRGEADYVKGDRFGEAGIRGTMGLPRWLGGRVFSTLTSLAIGRPVRDSQCGYTAISMRALEAIDLDALWPSFGYPNDLLGQLAALGAAIVAVPVKAVYGDETSKLRLRHLPPIFFLVARAATRRVFWRKVAWKRTVRPSVTRSGDSVARKLREGSAVSS